MYSFFIGASTLIPNLSWWAPVSHESVFRNSHWLVCWNFGRKSGEPMRPSPPPPK